MTLQRLTKRRIPDFLTQDQDTAQFVQALLDQQAGSSGGVTTFQALTDAFAFAGHALQTVRVNAGETALEAVAASAATSFTAPDQTISPTTRFGPFAHGLGALPTKFSGLLICQVLDHNYNPGDALAVSPGCMIYFDGSANHLMGYFVEADTSNIWLTYPNSFGSPGQFWIQDKSTLSAAQMTNGSWKLRVTVAL